MDDIWADRYWAHTTSMDELDAGELLGSGPSPADLYRTWGADIDIWDAREQEWL